jgi:hypothetical protein
MIRYGCRFFKGIYIFRLCVDNSGEFLDIVEVPQRLDAPCSSTGTDGNNGLGDASHFLDTVCIMGRGDGTFNKRNIIWPFYKFPESFWKVGYVQLLGDGKEFILAIQQTQLTAIT